MKKICSDIFPVFIFHFKCIFFDFHNHLIPETFRESAAKCKKYPNGRAKAKITGISTDHLFPNPKK